MTSSANPVVDHMITKADFGVQFDGKDWQKHETRVMGLTRAQLGNGIGVDADSSLFGIKQVNLHGTSAPFGHSFGFVLGHSPDKLNPEPVLTGQKAVFTDQTTGSAHLFHAISLPNKPQMEPIAIHETEEAKLQGTQTALRRAAGWRAKPDSHELLGPESVLDGVTESTVTAADGKKLTKYLVTPFSTGEEMRPSAMHRLLTKNGPKKSFFNGKYSPANRTMVSHNGQEAIVMTEADFNSIKAPLVESLSLQGKHPFENGLYIHMTKLDDQVTPDHVLVGGTIVREPLATTSSAFARLSDLVDDATESTKAEAAASTSELLKVIHPECKSTGAEMVMTDLGVGQLSLDEQEQEEEA